jgi:hypothetical protein
VTAQIDAQATTLERVGRVWVLDTETKGTGAEVVPLDKVRRDPSPELPLVVVAPEPRQRSEKPPEPRQPRRFKVVDVMTLEVLAEGAGARATIDLLKDVRSVVDVRIYVWDPADDRWRLLTLREQRILWDLRDR